MAKYRFKTEQEFKDEGLWDYKSEVPDFWNSEGKMNKYLGEDIPETHETKCSKNEGFYFDSWYFSNTDYVLKEQQYYDDLSLHIGRYIKALVDYPHSGGVKKGEIGKIIDKFEVNFPSQKHYSCTNALSEGTLGIRYKLLPEDYSPEQEIKEPNIEFIPGKWYKYNGWYIKYKEHDDDIWRSSEEITSYKKYSKKEGSFVDRDSDDKKILLIDLSEIQEYLPEGHPDKIKNSKFEKGKWYKWYQKNHGSFNYGKFDSITNTTIIMKPWIMHCDSYRETGSFDINSAQQITEVSYSEIEQFLPEDMKETKDFPKYWFVKNNKQPELLDYAGHISKESPKWWETYPYIGYDGVPSCKGIHGCGTHAFINNAIEVSFEDFLENVYYVKFPEKRKQKSEFVLPEKWYTKPKTNEEKDVLNKFVVDLKDNHWKIEDKYSYEHTPHFKNGNYQRSTWIGYEDNDYTEITFEQFKKYVLKDKSVTPTDKVKSVMTTSEEAVFVSSVVELTPVYILNVEDSKILPLPKSIESVKTKLN